MPRENDNPNVWKYYKIGDIVRDEEGSLWENKLFEISSFHGNAYLPLASVYMMGKPKTNGNMCNFDIRCIKLITAKKRPFRNVPRTKLIKMMNKGIMEARREFMMRLNTKTL